jgi:excinuclease ABC subunit C
VKFSHSRPDADVNPTDIFSHSLELPSPETPLERKVFPSHGGVFAFTDHHDRIIQTLSAENVRRAAEFRLQPPPESGHRGRADLRAIARRLWWVPTHSRFETMLTYLDVARKLWPRTYTKHLAFGPAWFISINLHERLPRWRVGRYAFAPQTADVGPFDTRRKAADFVSLLEELFDLCREYDILEQMPHGRPCAYFDMGKCPAPCDGSISLDAYRDMLAASLRFAAGDNQPRLSQLQSEMHDAASGRDFARAARIKQVIDRVRKALERDRSITPTPSEFNYFIVQRGERRSLIKPFFVNAGRIEAAAQVPLKEVSRHGTDWCARLTSPPPTDLYEPTHLSENIWLVAHFLDTSNRRPGLFLHANAATTPDKVVAAVHKQFPATNRRTNSDNARTTGFSVDQKP